MRGLWRLIAGNRTNLHRRLEPYIDTFAARHTSRRLLLISSSSNNNIISRFTSPISTPVVPSDFASSGLTNFAFWRRWSTGTRKARGTKGQKRTTLIINTRETPNPLSMVFFPKQRVMEVGSADFPNARTAMNSPLAKALFGIDGITRVFFGSDFVTVTKSDDADWTFLRREIIAAIMDFYSSGKPLFLDAATSASMDITIHEDDSETVARINELLETHIRPTVRHDGGNVECIGFDPESGVVKLKMQGACRGCPHSSTPLKSGIENMLLQYVPEVKAVEQEFDAEDENGGLASQLD